VEQARETPESQPAGTKRWLAPMVLWTAGLLLVLGLVWLVAAVGMPWWQVRTEVHDAVLSTTRLPIDCSAGHDTHVSRLGGEASAAHKLAVYLRLPSFMTEERAWVASLLGYCGQPAVPGLIQTLSDKEVQVRYRAAGALARIGRDSEPAIPALEKMLQDEDESLRRVAAAAMKKIRGEAAAP
jgi:hypothetical protein